MSSTKQAELRRLMKLQRQKKQQEPPDAVVAPKKVSGILKKPSKGILKTTTVHPATTKRQQEETQEQKSSTKGLSVLVSGYSSSSDDNDDEPKQPRAIVFVPKKTMSEGKEPVQDGVNTKEPQQHFSGTSMNNNVADVAQQGEHASAEIVHDQDDPSSASTVDKTAATTTATTTTRAVPQQERIADGVDPETWKEFEALVGGDGEDDKKKIPAAHADDVVAVASESPTVVEEMTLKQSQTIVEAPSIDTTEVEQASYETRLARLRVKAASKRKRKQPQATTMMEDDIPSYTPNLAFQHEEEEKQQSDEYGNNKVVSHLEILRRKRAKRRQLYGMEANEES